MDPLTLILLIYFGSVGLAFGSQLTYNALFERKKRKLGYVNRYGSILKRFVCSNWVGYLFVTICPIINFYWPGILIRYKSVSARDLDVEIKDSCIEPVEWAENYINQYSEDNHKLALRVLRVRKAQKRYKKKLAKKEGRHAQLLAKIESVNRDLSLPEKVIGVRRLQERSSMANRVKPYSEYTSDERIAMLLSELEIAYKEKAKEEGTDLEKEVALILDGKSSIDKLEKR